MSATIKGAATELGTERIRKLLMQYAVPAIIAMTASSLYNMVDSIFIGHGVGPLAISGLALTFPLMNLAAAFGSLVGVGAATLVSMRLGQRDYQTAQNILGNVVVLNLIIGLAFGFTTLLLLDPILYFFGAPAKAVFDLAKTKAKAKQDVFKIKGGYLTGKKVSAQEVEALAKLPSREQLLSMLLNSMLGPIRKLAYATVAIADKKEGSAE